MSGAVVAKIDTVTSLQEYFHTLVGGALKNHKVETLPEAEFYLVNLLKEFSLVDTLYQEKDGGHDEEPLALMLARALKSGHAARVAILRHMGDVSLYVAGFFPESFNRRLVNIKYYIQMGESAYGSLADLIVTPKTIKDVFVELGKQFVPFVDVLAEVSQKSHFQTNRNILKLYERWLHTGSKQVRDQLVQEGIVPQSHPSGKTRH